MQKITFVKSILPLIFLSIFFIVGFYYRLTGILENNSFWTDEAHIGNEAAEVISGKKDFLAAIRTPGINYQPLQLITVYISFLIFGVSEFSARLPSVVGSSLGIIFAYLLGAKLSSNKAGIIASFLVTFSHLNLANAIQAKPYSILQTIFLIIYYLLILLSTKPSSIFIQIGIILSIITAALFHYIGILFAIPYLLFVIYKKHRQIFANIKSPGKIFIFILFLIVVFNILNIAEMISYFLAPNDGKIIFLYNNTTYLRDILANKYIFITIPAMYGIVYLFNKNKIITIGMILWILSIIFLWNFRYYSHNIRYLVPLFGILFVYSAVFWDRAISSISKKNTFFPILVLIFFIFISGFKIVRKPQSYYSPNIDFFADVQNANYKVAFEWIKNNITNYRSLPIINNLYEAQLWYLKLSPPATFVKDYTFGIKPGGKSTHNITGKPVYTDLKSFEMYLKENPKGLLVVEDWESILPEDIKQYAKKNMKLEYRIESLEVSPTDKWPIEIYSWGME